MQKGPLKEPLFNKLKNFKKSTVVALANGTLDGPLCDTLLPLVSLCNVEKKIGRWNWDSQNGHTCLHPTAGRCMAEMPELSDGAANVDAMKEQLRTRVLHSLALKRETTTLGC